MADMSITVDVPGAKQATADLSALKAKINEAAAAGDRLATSQAKAAKATQAVGAGLGRQPREGAFAKVAGRLGGPLAAAGGLGEVANLGPALGAAAAGAVIVGSALKLAAYSLDAYNRQLLLGVEAQIQSQKTTDQVSKIRQEAGLAAYKEQGQNLIQLAGLGKAVKDVATSFAKQAPGGAADAQAAAIAASSFQGVGRDPNKIIDVLQQAVALANLEGLTLKDATDKILEAGGSRVSGKNLRAVSIAASEREGRMVSTEEVAARLFRMQRDSQAGTVLKARGLEGQTGLAQQGLLGYVTEFLSTKLTTLQNPEASVNGEAMRDLTVKLAALNEALSAQGPLVAMLDRLTNGPTSISGQIAKTLAEIQGRSGAPVSAPAPGSDGGLPGPARDNFRFVPAPGF